MSAVPWVAGVAQPLSVSLGLAEPRPCWLRLCGVGPRLSGVRDPGVVCMISSLLGAAEPCPCISSSCTVGDHACGVGGEDMGCVVVSVSDLAKPRSLALRTLAHLVPVWSGVEGAAVT